MAGFTFYDEEQFFKAFEKRRNRSESPNNSIEGPALWSLIDDVTGKDILDLGCGDGQFGLELIGYGAAYYHGIDGSKRMIHKAKELLGLQAELNVSDLTNLGPLEKKYDVIVSRLVLHYLPEVRSVFHEVYEGLRNGGQFLFSVQHPIITASMKSAQGGKRTDWIVDDYFEHGKRVEPWMDQQVTKYHRTTEHYVQALLNAGFSIEGLKEGEPTIEHFETKEEYERRKRIPLVLILSARKQ